MALLTALILTFLFFLPNLINGKIPFPADALLGLYHPFRDIQIDGYAPGTFPAKNTLITDPILQGYPWRHLVVDNFKSGNFPLWNPYSFSGQPLAANIQSAPFALFSILFLVLPFNFAFSMSLILPSILTTLFMYLFLKELNLSRVASAFGSFVLPFTGFFIAWLSWGSITGTVMWLPLILMAISKLAQKISTLWFLVLILAFSQTILSGHWQAASYVFAATLVFLMFLKKQIKNKATLLLISSCFILAILISMVQILPSLEFLKLSSRDLDQGFYPGRQDWFIPAKHLAQLLAPDFFGNPTTNNYWGIFNYGEFVSYVGIIPLSLAFLAIFAKNQNVKFFIVLAIIALLFGLENPISVIPFHLNFPLISSAQPSRIIFLLDFALAALAAFGLDYLLKEKLKAKFFLAPISILVVLVILLSLALTRTNFSQDLKIDTAQVTLRNLIVPTATVIIFLLVIFAKKLNLPQKLIVFTIFSLTILELFRFGTKFISFSKISWIFPNTQTTQFLEKQEKPFRVITTDRRILHPNTSAVYGIESTDGYDPLYLLAYNQLVSSWQSNNPNAKPSAFNRIVTAQKFDSPITNLLNVKYILTFDELDNPNFVKVFEEGQTKVYENLKALPRFYFVDQVTRSQSDADELQKLLLPNFKRITTSQEFDFNSGSAAGNIQIHNYQDQNVTLKTSNQKQTPLVISNINYPGWKAYIDGQKAQIYKTNYLLQSVIVPAGEHQVELKFQPQSFYNGLYLTLAGLFLTALASALIWKKKFQ